MKKITAILLLSLYSLSTLGISLKSFYCCGDLESITLSSTQNEKKQCANGDNTSDCCKTKYQYLKVKDSHVTADVIHTPDIHFINLHLNYASFQSINYSSQDIYISHQSNAPPLLHSVPDYIFNCVFRVWLFLSSLILDKACFACCFFVRSLISHFLLLLF